MRDFTFDDCSSLSFFKLLNSDGTGPPNVDELYGGLHYMDRDIGEDNMLYIFSLYDLFYAKKKIICYDPFSIVAFPFFLAHSNIVALMQKTKSEIKNLYTRGYDTICLRI